MKKHLPAFADWATLLSDRDNEIAAAVVNMFAENIPHHLFCIRHCLDSFARHGRGIIGVYNGIVLALTVETVA